MRNELELPGTNRNHLERAGTTWNKVEPPVTTWTQQRTETKNKKFIEETVRATTLPNRLQNLQ